MSYKLPVILKLLLVASMVLLFGTACDGYLSSVVSDVSPVVEIGNPEGAGSGFVSVSAGDFHTCGLREDRSILCWGTDWYGMATAPSGSFDSVTLGYDFTCGLRTDGYVECWGDRIDEPWAQFLSISAGKEHVCGVTVGGDVECWWSDDSRREGSTPEGKFVAVESGLGHACGIRSGGSVTCWSSSDDGQASLPAGAGTFATISSGSGYSCGLTTDGRLVCWAVGRYHRVEAPPPSDSFISVSVGGFHACGLRSDRSAVCWGDLVFTRTGVESLGGLAESLLGVDEGERSVVEGPFDSVSAGYRHACGVRTGGEVVCWGSNSDSQARPPVVRVDILVLSATAVVLALSLSTAAIVLTDVVLFARKGLMLAGIAAATVLVPFAWAAVWIVDLLLPSTFILTAAFLGVTLYFRNQSDVTITLVKRRVMGVLLSSVSVAAAMTCVAFFKDPAFTSGTSSLDWALLAVASAVASIMVPIARPERSHILRATAGLAILAGLFGTVFLLLLHFGLSHGGANFGAFLLSLPTTVVLLNYLARVGEKHYMTGPDNRRSHGARSRKCPQL